MVKSNLGDILGDVAPVLGSKNPQVKEGSLKFLVRCLSTSSTPIQPAQIKPLSEQLATLLEDSFEGARNEAATALGTLMRMVGERPLNAIMDSLPEVRKSKVKEAHEKAVVRAKTGASGPPKPSGPPPTKAPPQKKAPHNKAGPKNESPTPTPEETLEAFDEPQKAAKKPPARPLVCHPNT
jgi:cytoskeleton-associated protein 5